MGPDGIRQRVGFGDDPPGYHASLWDDAECQGKLQGSRLLCGEANPGASHSPLWGKASYPDATCRFGAFSSGAGPSLPIAGRDAAPRTERQRFVSVERPCPEERMQPYPGSLRHASGLRHRLGKRAVGKDLRVSDREDRGLVVGGGVFGGGWAETLVDAGRAPLGIACRHRETEVCRGIRLVGFLGLAGLVVSVFRQDAGVRAESSGIRSVGRRPLPCPVVPSIPRSDFQGDDGGGVHRSCHAGCHGERQSSFRRADRSHVVVDQTDPVFVPVLLDSASWSSVGVATGHQPPGADALLGSSGGRGHRLERVRSVPRGSVDLFSAPRLC